MACNKYLAHTVATLRLTGRFTLERLEEIGRNKWKVYVGTGGRIERNRHKTIYTDLNRSKNWFFKWLKRYQTGAPNWFRDKSKAPSYRPRQISEIDRQRIVSVRTRLESERFAQIGASAIKWELSKSRYSFPSDRTINRVLKREGLIKKNFVHSQGR